MRGLMSIVGGAFILIAIYLFISDGDKTVQVINALANNSVLAVKTLQGR